MYDDDRSRQTLLPIPLMKVRLLIILILVAILTSCDGDSDNSGPAPVLSSLEVAGARTDLNPVFESGISRYSVISVEGGGALTITPEAIGGLVISVNDEITASGTAVTLEEATPGDTVAVEVENNGGATTVYEIVYLPEDFPELEVTVLEEGVSEGFVYLTPRFATTSYMMIVDNNGVPTYYKKEASRIADFKLHPTGERSYALTSDDVNEWGRRIVDIIVMNDAFEEVDRVRTVNLTHTDFHEFVILDDGRYVLMAYEGARRDLTPYGGEVDQVVEDSVVQEITRDREILAEWNSWGDVPYDEVLRDDPVEYAHINSVFVDTDGDWIISVRGTSQVIKVDKLSGEVLWRLGGISNEFTFVDDPYANLCGQHTAYKTDSGTLLLFDNGQFCWPENEERGDLTRIAEFDLDIESRTATLVWSYDQEGVYSRAAGAAQRLGNGNTFIGWGIGTELLATEVDSRGHRVFEIKGRFGENTAQSYRAFRFSK